MPKRKIDRDALEFGARLVQLLAAHGVVRRGAGAYLHRRYGVSNVTANDWLNGKFKPENETARQIAHDHGVSFDTLYFGGNVPGGIASEEHIQDLKLASLEKDVEAISIALGALAATMVVHRPAEAVEAAEAFRQVAPPHLLENGLIHELIAVLERAKSPRR